MADYDQLMQALRNAHAAGDTAAAQRLAQMARAARQTSEAAGRIAASKAGTLTVSPESAASAAAADEAAMAQMQPQASVVGDIAAAVPSGLSRGVTGLLDAPGMLFSGGANLAASGLERAGIVSPNVAEGIRSSLAFGPMGTGSTARESASLVTGGASEYQPQTVPGQFFGTVSEFLPGALIGGTSGMLPRALQYGVVPGVASETAGQAAEAAGLGETGQTISRLVGAVGGGMLASRPGAFVGDDETARMANVLRDAGVDVSTGQGTGSQALMRMEGRLAPTNQQLDDFTAATMKMLGSDAKVATPTNLAATQKSLVDQMDNAVSGVTITPNATQAQAAVDVAANYIARVPTVQLTPRIRGIANEIKALAAAGKDVSLSRLKEWRSDIGAFTVSDDPSTRQAAHALRKLIDDMTDAALIAAGRSTDIAALAKAREAYRNFIGVRDAATRAGAEGGILSPTALNQSMIRAQGRENYAVGSTTPMADFTRSAAATLRAAPATSPGGVRSISEALPLALASMAGAGSYGAGLGPLGIGLAAAGGALAPSVGQMAMRSAPAQAMLRDPLGTLTQIGRTIPGLLAQ